MQYLNLTTGIPGDFFTVASLGTLAGATGAVYRICNTIHKVFNFNPRWLALLVSILISYLGAALTVYNNDQVIKYFIALLNGFLIYATATGTNQVTGRKDDTTAHHTVIRQHIKKKRQFSTRSW